ncbi:hypothetical protein CEUSTIGMA_g6408.t1 [Chlamydomonas eustigma]|uniref:Caffeoyl-CoA O-methyltransferase n=1 Tax=Chlamydomonas eustigma TaxID=1157962 RepID=A0A250X7B0_9CHLO|nr:hypothetical protein CEUSTIGMA_g6408.t1 [Chlamydomonas eustigma]|eukprot:GAX78968.1 hypothetical protein CEUSTIGMA_g6408.t1 [Chlamydomonas eustigma]
MHPLSLHIFPTRVLGHTLKPSAETFKVNYYSGHYRALKDFGICRGSRQPNEVGLSSTLSLKVPASMNMTTELYTYLLEHTREPQVLQDLRDETAAMNGSHMQITRDQGQFMSMLVKLTGTKRAVELGVYTGYSSLVVAMALPEDGKLYAIDKDERSMAVARKYWQLSGVNNKVVERLGNAQGELKQLLEEFGQGSFDMGFIDADKRVYHLYYELMLKLMKPGGIIVVDNVLFYGKVVKPEAGDKAAAALAEFNKVLFTDERIDLSIIPVGDGMALCRKR